MYSQTFDDTTSSHFSSDFKFCRSVGKSEVFEDEVEQEGINSSRMFESARTFLTTCLMILALLSLLELDLFPVFIKIVFLSRHGSNKSQKMLIKFTQLITKFLN